MIHQQWRRFVLFLLDNRPGSFALDIMIVISSLIAAGMTAGLSALIASSVIFKTDNFESTGISERTFDWIKFTKGTIGKWIFPNGSPEIFSLKFPLDFSLSGNPDLFIQVGHFVNSRSGKEVMERRPSGYHHRYSVVLSVFPNPGSRVKLAELNKCQIAVEWNFPRELFIDRWALERSTNSDDHLLQKNVGHLEWSVLDDATIDLEAPAFDHRAKPFKLTAIIKELPSAELGHWKRHITVPDLLVRYMAPDETKTIGKVRIPIPHVRFFCLEEPRENPITFRIDSDRSIGFSPINISVPVPPVSSIFGHATIAFVIICMTAIIISLIRH